MGHLIVRQEGCIDGLIVIHCHSKFDVLSICGLPSHEGMSLLPGLPLRKIDEASVCHELCGVDLIPVHIGDPVGELVHLGEVLIQPCGPPLDPGFENSNIIGIGVVLVFPASVRHRIHFAVSLGGTLCLLVILVDDAAIRGHLFHGSFHLGPVSVDLLHEPAAFSVAQHGFDPVVITLKSLYRPAVIPGKIKIPEGSPVQLIGAALLINIGAAGAVAVSVHAGLIHQPVFGRGLQVHQVSVMLPLGIGEIRAVQGIFHVLDVAQDILLLRRVLITAVRRIEGRRIHRPALLISGEEEIR